MNWLRPKWQGRRWRPGLDLANLGLLVGAAILAKAVWDSGALERWLPGELHVVAAWVLVAGVALWTILDVLGAVDDFREGIRRTSQSESGSSRSDSGDAAV